jgi:hypothetical protein
MANDKFSFYYDPIRQGYDTDTWTTLAGAPVIAANKLSLDGAAILHYADLLRGDASFCLNMPAPAAGDDTKFGLTEYNKGAYLYFKIADDVLTAECSDGTTTESTVIDWVADWTDTDTVFRIKWEAGVATFFIGGQQKVALTNNYDLDVPDIVIPGDPMSLYLKGGSATALLVKYIEVMGVQSSDLTV